VAGGVLYFLFPLDLMPEALLGVVGYIDDILVLTVSVLLAKKLQSFRKKDLPSPLSSPKNPYAILGLMPGATEKEIIKAYRQKMTEYHPDKVAHLGEGLNKVAHEKTLEIQNAYEALMKKK